MRFSEALFKHSKPEDWPHDLWSMENQNLKPKIINVLNKYRKLLPEKNNQTQVKQEHKIRENRDSQFELPPCPLLIEQEHKLVNQFEEYLEQWNYPDAVKMLDNYPFLYKVLKSEKGGSLLQTLFVNMLDFNELNMSEELEMTFSGPETLLMLLKKNGINPAHFLGKHNVLLTIIKKQSAKEAAYLFDMLSTFFSNAIPVLANDKSSGNTPIELALMLQRMICLKNWIRCVVKRKMILLYMLHEAVQNGNL